MLVETLAESGHEVDLLTYHEGESVPLGDAQLHRIPSLPFIRDINPGFSIEKVVCDVVMAARAAQMARNRDYDVIHAVEEASFIARGLQWLTRTPYVFDMDSSMPEQIVNDYQAAELFQPLLEAMEAWVIHGSEAVVVVCEALEDRVRDVDPNLPVLRLEDVSMLDDTEVEEDLRQDLSVEAKLLMYVGNLKRYQGIDLLIDAFHLVSKEDDEAHLMIIGGSDRRIETYRDRAVERGVAERVHFLGPRPLDHLGGYLRQADILVSPRTQGTNTPMKVYSYLDSGRPVVATRKRTHTQVLDDKIAMLAEPTPDAMAEALLRLLQDENLRERLAENAQTRVAEEYSREAFRRKLTDFYETLEQDIVASGEHDASGPVAVSGQ
jgi:glycosyltransferase involved in cell wall biosynthesis